MRVTIEKLAYGGEGIARPGKSETVVFVPRAAANDVLEVEVVEEKPRFRRASILKVVEGGEARTTPPCPHYQGKTEATSCNGCQYQHLTYAAQLAAKAEQLGQALNRIGGFTGVPVRAPIAAPAPLHYRNKGTFRWNPEAGAFGLIAVDSKSVLPIDACPLLSESADRVFRAAGKVARDLANESPEFRAGVLSLIVRAGTETGETLAALVVRQGFPRELAEKFSSKLRTTTKVTSVVYAEHPRPGEALIDPQLELLDGARFIREKLNGLTFLLDAETFFQVNTPQAEKLYRIAIDGARLNGSEVVLDLFCGNGGISLSVAKHARKVIGVDVVRRSIERAVDSAQENGFDNVRFVRQDAADAIKKFVHAEKIRPDVIFLDPPRAGLKGALIKNLAKLGAKTIVYVSCNPATLARDLKAMAATGYFVREVTPVDLFPQTFHLECVAVLEKR